ncbi:type IV-A pilus assembly ATPase PilB [Vibrio inusitatus NBRC 102082]|uniref:Type IV-A pilus assembly ATPase PilB n=1 Tax=Vibrio inusitatus NBRC 102082 TaxID=1219070 RepID=A0A4Y3I1U0_9VIBR|nr:GspE/PulE family protein [Vibrio inusitatus]GEA52802.1 type IV-A pilus assembly ATPase PilB [Vibrio inusitatus NBRC 102082]
MIHPVIASLSPVILNRDDVEQLSQRTITSTEDALYQVSEVSQHTLTELGQSLANHHQLIFNPSPNRNVKLTTVITTIKELHLEHIVAQHPIVPISLNNGVLQLLSFDPFLESLLAELQFHHRINTQLILTDIEQFQYLYTQVKRQLDSQNHHCIEEIELLPQIMHQSQQRDASDIHIEPDKDQARVRVRCDGLLVTIMQFSLNKMMALVSQIKIYAELDITEQRLPQDGRMSYALSEKEDIEVRVSTLPTLWGEKLVMRIAKESESLPKLDELGLKQEQCHALKKALKQPQGLILVTGPTGSGKTITLYSCLSTIANTRINICTVEDPVEIHFQGFNQVQTNVHIGLNFARCLRSLLRQDPDVIMLGEIRDSETAEIAIHAAQTGHLVLSTLHTNSAFSTLDRLYQLGINQVDIIDSLQLVVAQRLLRKSCPHCAQKDSKHICYHCNEGYKGRMGVFELLPITRQLLSNMAQLQNSEQLSDNYLIGEQNLLEVAKELCLKKVTTKQEVERVLGHE